MAQNPKQQAYKTQEDSPEDVEILGVVGYAGPNAKAGILVERVIDAYPHLFSDSEGTLLKGAELKNAISSFGSARNLDVVSVTDDDVAQWPHDLGRPGDPPPAVDQSIDRHAFDMGEDVQRRELITVGHDGVLRDATGAEYKPKGDQPAAPEPSAGAPPAVPGDTAEGDTPDQPEG